MKKSTVDSVLEFIILISIAINSIYFIIKYISVIIYITSAIIVLWILINLLLSAFKNNNLTDFEDEN